MSDLQRLALGREPEAVVDHLGVARDERVAEVHHLAVHRERLDRAVRRVQDRAARRLVDAARLHADVAVLDEVDAADAVLAAESVQPLEQRHRSEPLPVDRDRIAGLEVDLDRLRLVGRLLGGAVSRNMSSGGSAHGSSRMPPS